MAEILSILSRDYATTPECGRKVIVTRLVEFLSKRDTVTFIPSMSRSLGFWLHFVLHTVLYVEPFQVALFNTRENIDRLADLIRTQRPRTIFVEGGRLEPLLDAAIRKANCYRRDFKIIVDIDDLMSRRYKEYRRIGAGLQMGMLGASLQKYVNAVGKFFTNCVLSIEAGRMKRCEIDIMRTADHVLFSSDYERRMAMKMATPSSAHTHRHIVGFPPVRPYAQPKSGDVTFCFIGSDKLFQNYLSIQKLTDLWKDHNIPHKLIVIGKCTRSYVRHPNVTFAGFVPDIGKIYETADAMLSFSYVKGGLKIKNLEAFSLGLPVVLNNTSAEGLVGFEDCEMKFDEQGLIHFLRQSPDAIRSALATVAQKIPAAFDENWTQKKLDEFLTKLFA
jgi:glycosyltransferase involved in cell wall biosynthesis